MSALTAGLSGCGAPAYTYVADSAAGTYYKVPSAWHRMSQQELNMILTAIGSPTSGIWSAAFDASTPSPSHFLQGTATRPFVFAEVGKLPTKVTNELSYNMLRDFLLPVTATTRQQDAKAGFQLTNFKQLRDQTIAAAHGVHGVRETFQYTFPDKVTDTFDEDVLTNADETTVYFLLAECTAACYAQNQNNINTVMSSFTVGSPT